MARKSNEESTGESNKESIDSETAAPGGGGAELPNIKVVSPGRNLTVDQAERVKSEILTAFESSKVVAMALSNVETIDLAGVHLLYGAKREAAKQGKTFRLTGTVQHNVAQTLVTSGFSSEVPSDANELSTMLLEFEPKPQPATGVDDRES